MLLKDLIFLNECQVISPSESSFDISISHIVHRTQDVRPGCLFVCLKGAQHDTHDNLDEVIKKGAQVVVVERMPEKMPESPPIVIQVPSCRRAWAWAWSRFCGSPSEKLCMIGITGTNGKTSTSTMLEWVLRASGHHTALIGTICCTIDGTPISPKSEGKQSRIATMTTPDPDILYPFLAEAVHRGVTHVVMEVSSHALALEKVCPIHFEEAIFTNLSSEHMDFHHTMDDYMAAKTKLFLQTSHATICMDDAFGARLANCLPYPITSCGCVWKGDATASQVELGHGGIKYFYQMGRIRNIVRVHLPGTFTVYNSLLALTSAIHLGVAPHRVIQALETLIEVPGRMQRISDETSDIDVYIDYAHTEAALKNLLLTVRAFAKGKLVLVFGCGGDRDPSKRSQMGRCAAELADYSYITSDNSRTEDPNIIISQILEGHQKASCRKVILDRKVAIETAILEASSGDIVLLVGKGHENYEIKGTTLLPFDEREIATLALQKRASM